MDNKWIAICIIGFAFGMFSPVVVDSYTKGQCRVAYSQSDKTAEGIVKICGK